MASKIIKPIALFKDMLAQIGITFNEENVPKKPIKRLLKLFGTIDDVRLADRISYPLCEILMVAFFAILSGASTWTELEAFGKVKRDWLRKFMALKEGTPSHDTFKRVFSLIDPECLQKATITFLIDNFKLMKRAFNINQKGLTQYCVDGKEANGTGRNPGLNEDEKRNIQTLHVYDLSNAICLVSKVIDTKTNEIPAAQEVLKNMQLKNVVVSFDAMNTQTKTISVIVEQKGDYIGTIKSNHKNFYEEIESYFSSKRLDGIKKRGGKYYETREKARNSIETRQYYLTNSIAWFYNTDEWEKLRSIVCYVKTSENIRTGKKTQERRYYLSSLLDVETCASAIRGHWSVENQLHWHLDVNFLEDDNMTTDRNAFQNFSLMNKLALSITKLASTILKTSVRSSRKIMGWEIDTINKILCTFDEDILTEALVKAGIKK